MGAAVCPQTLLTKTVGGTLGPQNGDGGQYKILTLESGWELGEMQASKAFTSHDNHEIWSVLITDTIPFCGMYVPIMQKHRAWRTTGFPEDPPGTCTSSSTQHFLM